MKLLCKNKYWNIVKEYNINKILYLLIDRPDYINDYNSFYWINKGEGYRNYDLPYYISCEGTPRTKQYCINDNSNKE